VTPRNDRARLIDEGAALRLVLLERTIGQTGREFLRSLVRNLCRALDTRGSWVTEYLPDRRRLRSLAFWLGDNWVDSYEYDVEGTPCQTVIDTCRLIHIPDRVVELFPRDPDLAPLGGVSYLGIPLLNADRTLLGHLAVLDSKPLSEDPRIVTIFEVFAERAAAEIRRLRAEQEVRSREQQLASLLDSAMDGVLVIDEHRRIVRTNPATARILATDENSLTGQSLEQFLDRASWAVLDERIADMSQHPVHERRFWFPRGLGARRADGSEFSAEATLSCFETNGALFHLLILRDVNDRIAIENRMRRLAEDADYYRQASGEAPGGGQLLGQSLKMQRLFKAIRQVSATDATVLVLGETGTGKELIARAIHETSSRRRGPLVRVNCAAIPGTLIESELFGHERGAFTGAVARREGRFALADGGTIFLDEIGELSPDLQAKLLRVLQEGEFEPLGSTRTKKVNVRVIAATHRDLGQMVRDGRFRDDLYYRLNVFPLIAPPLRERQDDVVLLAESFVARFAARMGRRIGSLGPADVQRLRHYDWPGNVRELQNVIERALILADGDTLDLARAMPMDVSVSAEPTDAVRAPAAADVADGVEPARVLTALELQLLERENIVRALDLAGWKLSGPNGAARLLGVPSSTLASRMKALNVRRPPARV
jgi:formate hydrogenlyase transcriptional activator